MDNVVSLNAPTGNPEVVEHFRVLLSDAQNGRLVSYVVARISDTGQVSASYYYDCEAHQLALGTILNPEVLSEHTE